MAVTVQSFRARWGKPFDLASDELVGLVLAQAARRMNARIWGDQYDDGVLLLAAHLIVIDRGGQFARMATKGGSSSYIEEWEAMRDSLLIGDRVI